MRVRCEGCGHPQAIGTWTSDHRGMLPGPDYVPSDMVVARRLEAAGYVHFTPCDPGCDHGTPAQPADTGPEPHGWEAADSWRSIRGDKLLCLRCAEERA